MSCKYRGAVNVRNKQFAGLNLHCVRRGLLRFIVISHILLLLLLLCNAFAPFRYRLNGGGGGDDDGG